ncbi:MAG: CoxG family protein [Motilibacteraceae bacterium]
MLASPEQSWSTLTDVPQVAGWVSIVEDAKELSPLDRYTAVLMDRLGPFKLRADLDIVVTALEPGRSITFRASGEDRQVGSRLVIEAAMSVEPRTPEGSLARFDGVYEVTGRVASMGSGTINKKADKLMAEFFAAAEAALGGA